jgi:hypothetical protein
MRNPTRLGQLLVTLSVVAFALLASAGSAGAATATAPWWALSLEGTPARLQPGGEGKIILAATDIGDAGVNATHSPIVVSDTVPASLEVSSVNWNVGFGSPTYNPQWPTGLLPPCTTVGQTVSCKMEPFEPFLPVAALEPNQRIEVEIGVKVKAGAASGEPNEATISGGEPLACHEVAPETGAFVDDECHGEYPFNSPFLPSNHNMGSRNFEQEAVGRAAPPAHTEEPIVIGDGEIPFGVAKFDIRPEEEGGAIAFKAGSHPDQLTTTLVLNQRLERKRGVEEGPENAQTLGVPPKNLSFELPPGLIGNPNAIPRCSAAQFFSKPSAGSVINECPADTAVGVAMVTFDEPQNVKLVTLPIPIFNIEPTFGEPARFGFFAAGALPVVLDASVRSGGDYGVTITAHRVPEISALLSSQVTFWGEPGAAAHAGQRGWSCVAGGFYRGLGEPLPSCAASRGSGAESKPFLRMPTSCGTAQLPMRIQSWAPGADVLGPIDSATELQTQACNQLPFGPTLEVEPDIHAAASPSGLTVDLKVPQEAGEAPGGLAEADLRDAKVELPEGVVVNASSANGLAACTPEQVELHGSEPVRCPDASKIGSVVIHTPLLERPLEGGVYVAQPHENPFGSLLAIYIAVDDPQDGVVVKLAGKVEADPATGRLTTTFEENPQLPFEDFRLHFFGGPQAALATPPTCATYSTQADLTPWTSPEGADARVSSSFPISSGPEGRACAQGPAEEPNAPSFSAGTVSPLAGNYSPFVLHLKREDGSQVLQALNVTLPKGLVARLAGTPYCPEAAIAAAEAKSGVAEQANASCPVASEIGKVTVGAGAGPQPYLVSGRAYLAGPYKGAPLSIVIVTPAVAGPYDLGTVVVRSPLYVDESTAQVTVKSDPIPTILQGIPLDVRSVAIAIDRPQFTLNPTSCEASTLTGSAISSQGSAAALADRFQVGGCKGLAFKPKLKLSFTGQTKRTGFPGVRAVLTQPKGDNANVAGATVILPKGLLIANAHINNPCTRVQFNSAKLPGEGCPAKSVLGMGKVWTPLLEKPEEGKVYFRSNGGERELPDLVVALRGQVPLQLVGFIDSVGRKGAEVRRVRSRFLGLPDAPVSRFELRLTGGRKGLLQNSKNLCTSRGRAKFKLGGQNGKMKSTEQMVHVSCGSKAKKRHRSKH